MVERTKRVAKVQGTLTSAWLTWGPPQEGWIELTSCHIHLQPYTLCSYYNLSLSLAYFIENQEYVTLTKVTPIATIWYKVILRLLIHNSNKKWLRHLHFYSPTWHRLCLVSWLMTYGYEQVGYHFLSFFVIFIGKMFL